MSKTHLVVPDQHAHFEHHNKRAEWLGSLILDIKPDVVIMMGDACDFPSLCSYDKGKKSFEGRTYKKDIEAHSDFQDRLWSTVRRGKKKMPMRVSLIGNHEQRISRAIEVQPELDGVISYDDLELDRYYDCVVPYTGSTPGSINIDGITYAHYLVSGTSGRPISGEHHAYSLLAKRFSSCTVAHSHTMDICVRTKADGKKIFGLVAGVYQDYDPPFAGDASSLWWRGVVLKRNVEEGVYDPQFISLDAIKKNYS
jgi:hypothetical protein